MAKATANIPTQKNLVAVIEANISTSSTIIDVVINHARKCEKYNVVKDTLDNYNNVITYVFGEAGVLETVISTVNNINAAKFNTNISEIKDFIGNLEDLIRYINRKLIASSNIIDSTDLMFFEKTYFNFISGLNNVFNIINKVRIKPFLRIKLFFVRLQFGAIKKFVEKISDDSIDLIKSLIKSVSSMAKFALLEQVVSSLNKVFTDIDNIKVNNLLLWFKLRRIRKSLKMLFKTVETIGSFNISVSKLLKAVLAISVMSIIYNSFIQIIDVVRNVKIGIKFYIKLFFLKRAIKRLGSMITVINKITHKNKISFGAVKTFLFMAISLRFITSIFNTIRSIKTFLLNRKIKKVTTCVKSLKTVIGIISKMKVNANSIKLVRNIRKYVKELKEILRLVKKIKTWFLAKKILTITTCIGLLDKLFKKIRKVKISRKDLRKITLIKNVIKKLNYIITSVAVTGVLAIVSTVSLLAISLFVLALIGTIMLIGILLKLVRRTVKRSNRNLRRIIVLVGTLMLVGAALLLFAVMTPIIVEAITGVVIPFILFLGLSVLMIWVLSWLIKKMAKSAAKNLLRVALNIIIIAGVFIIVGAALLIVGYIGQIFFTSDLWIYMLLTIAVITGFVMGACVLSKYLNKRARSLTAAVKNLAMLITITGKLLIIGAMLLGFGLIGMMMTAGNTEINIAIGIGVVIAYITVLSLLSKAFSKVQSAISKSLVGLGLLIIVTVELLAIGAMLLLLGKQGDEMRTGNTALNILIAVGAITAFAAIMSVLGFGMQYAIPFMLMTLAGAAILIAVEYVLLEVGKLLLKLGDQGQEFIDNNVKENVLKLISDISSIGWRIAGLGAEMIVISMSCGILTVFIWPYLAAIVLVREAAESIAKISDLEINLEAAKENMNKIKGFFGAYKKFVKSFSLKDIIVIQMTKSTVNVVNSSINAIANIAEKLNTVQEINIRSEETKKKVEAMLNLVTTLQSLISSMVGGATGGNWFTRWKRIKAANEAAANARTKLNRVEKIVMSLKNIAGALTEIQDINLNTSAILSNIDFVFQFIGTLETHIKNALENATVFDDQVTWVYKKKWWGGYWEQQREENQSLQRLNKVDQVVSTLQNVCQTLQQLQGLYINESKILKNVTFIFNFIETLAQHLEKCIANTKVLEDKVTWKWVKHKWYQRGSGHWEKHVEENAAVKALNKVDQVVSSIQNVATTIQQLNDIKLSPEDQQNILGNVDYMFAFIGKLSVKIDELFNAKSNVASNTPDFVKAAREQLKNKDFEKSVEYLGNVGNVAKTLSDITDSIKKIKDFRIDNIDKQIIEKNVSELFDTSNRIADKVNEYLGSAKQIGDVSVYTSSLQELSNTFDSLGESDTSKFKTNTETFARFFAHVNSIDLEKMKSTTDMFKQMTEMSNSIKGNFDKLAEALTHKMLPVLEELKEVMSDVPEKLEQGFSNTSASIGAINAAPTRTNYEAQVQRENPNLSKKDVERIVNSRLNEKSRSDANGIAAKLDELISMFKGYSSPAIVRTV